MTVEAYFKPERVYLLVRNAIVLNRSSILVITSALAGVLILISLFDAYGGCRQTFHRNVFLTVFFPGGILLTTRIFKALHDPVKGFSWLLLPASVLEKTLTCILLTTLVYMAGGMMFYLVFSLVSEGLNMLVFHSRHPLFNPFDRLILNSMQTYVSIQAPFLIGAVYFQKHALSKTILALFFSVVIFGIGILLAARIIFGDALSRLMEYNSIPTFDSSLMNAVKVFFGFAVPLISWIICYFRHKETEL